MAHFLIDASLPRATGDVIRAHGHDATDVREIGLGTAADPVIAAYAVANRFSLVTGDGDFGNLQQYPPENYFGIVVICAPAVASKAGVLNLVEGFLQQADLLANLKGRLFIVEPGRIRARPPV